MNHKKKHRFSPCYLLHALVQHGHLCEGPVTTLHSKNQMFLHCNGFHFCTNPDHGDRIVYSFSLQFDFIGLMAAIHEAGFLIPMFVKSFEVSLMS